MKNKKYKLPLQLGTILRKEQHPTCANIGESIAQNIHLIILTSFGEHRYDRKYGCSLWESDFAVVPQVKKWQNEMSKNLGSTIEKHEKRLNKVLVSIKIDQEEFMDPVDQKVKRIKKRIQVEVKGKLRKTNEDFSFHDIVYYSPVSLD